MFNRILISSLCTEFFFLPYSALNVQKELDLINEKI